MNIPISSSIIRASFQGKVFEVTAPVNAGTSTFCVGVEPWSDCSWMVMFCCGCCLLVVSVSFRVAV